MLTIFTLWVNAMSSSASRSQCSPEHAHELLDVQGVALFTSIRSMLVEPMKSKGPKS